MSLSNRIHESQKKEFSKHHITKDFVACKLSAKQGLLTVIVQLPLTVNTLVEIVINAYLKLGCNRIKYCIGDRPSYNLFIQPYSNSTMVYTVNKAESTSTFAKTVRIEDLAEKANLPISQVNELIEESKVSVILKNGEWVLPRQSAETLIHNLYNQKKEYVLSGLFEDSEGAVYSIEEEKSEPEVEPLQTAAIESSDFDDSMKLSSTDFDIMAGRQRRPDIATGLKIAIESLPGGNSVEGFNRYIIKIMSKTDTAAKEFLATVAEHYPTKKSAEVVTKLKEAALKYWSAAS